jgi:hypothetical protein
MLAPVCRTNWKYAETVDGPVGMSGMINSELEEDRLAGEEFVRSTPTYSMPLGKCSPCFSSLY